MLLFRAPQRGCATIVAPVVVWVTLQACSAVLPGQNIDTPEKEVGSRGVVHRLAQTTYHKGEERRELLLCMEEFPIALERAIRLNPPKEWLRPVALDDNPPFGNLIFQLVDSSDTRSPKGKVVWVAYMVSRKGGGAPERWSGDVVWDPRTRRAHVVLVQSRGQYGYNIVRVYEASPTQIVTGYPMKLDASRPQEWPKTGLPIAQVWTRGLLCAIARVRVASRGNVLVIRGQTEKGNQPQIEWHYDIEQRKWVAVP